MTNVFLMETNVMICILSALAQVVYFKLKNAEDALSDLSKCLEGSYSDKTKNLPVKSYKRNN